MHIWNSRTAVRDVMNTMEPPLKNTPDLQANWKIYQPI